MAFALRISLGVALICVAASPHPTQGIEWPQLALAPAITGLSQPTHITNAGDGSGRLFVVDQAGYIRIVKNGVVQATPFLDIHSRISCCGERGLLSVAFPPGYATKGYFYVYYTNPNGDIVVARYFVIAGNPDVADSNSEVVVLTVPHPTNTNHNGGQLAFGPDDGFLYIGTGDGGGAGDLPNNAQTTTVLLGKILRIDVESGATPYAVPQSNPYRQTSGYLPEIWAFGVRNPWRFSFDRQTHDLYIGEVGQNLYEEIDYQPAGDHGGENYGWRIMEGFHCYNASTCTTTGLTLPVFEYPHTQGACSITGGFVYRAAQFPRMQGIYIYADYCAGRISGLQRNGATWENMLLYDASFQITTFGEDEAGNVYVANANNGSIAMLIDQPTTPTSTDSPSPTQTPLPTITPTATPPPLCIRLTPNGLGTVQSQNLVAGCAANWQCAQNDDGDTAYVYSPPTAATGPRIDLYAFDNVAPRSEPIVSVSVRIVSRSLTTANSSATTQLRPTNNATTYSGAPLAVMTAYGESVTSYPLNPYTNQAWTWSDINSLQAGVRHQVATGDEVRTTQVSIDVCWVPGPESGPLSVTGQVVYAGSGLPVDGVTMQLSGPLPYAGLTNTAGRFAFLGLPSDTWAIEPRKLQGAGTAINAADALAVIQAAVGSRPLNRAQQLACDVNGDGRISAVDALLIIYHNVGAIGTFPLAQRCGSDWIFVPEPQTTANQLVTAPGVLSDGCRLGSIEWLPLAEQATNQNFTAALIGDCSGSWQPGTP